MPRETVQIANERPSYEQLERENKALKAELSRIVLVLPLDTDSHLPSRIQSVVRARDNYRDCLIGLGYDPSVLNGMATSKPPYPFESGMVTKQAMLRVIEDHERLLDAVAAADFQRLATAIGGS